MISRVLLTGLATILVGGSIVWYWENAASEVRPYLFYTLLIVFIFNIFRSIYKEEKLESKIKELAKN
ncbi:MAG: hypothetical protein OQK04_03340 [Kangiellaceae bacterium]|nr:hypothetical protein [Kangiellaceae bacterium]MCW8997740.1 hypothetical protein [Kangiellaceae bacterium]